MDHKRLAKSEVYQGLRAAQEEIPQLGGLQAFRSGDWLLQLIRKSFQNYSERATPECLRSKYPELSREQITQKLIDLAAANAALAGGLTGAAISMDELLALFTAGEAGMGIPANIAVALLAVSSELYLTTKIQMQLVARLGALYEVPLEMDDPEDILTILAFAFGGAVAEQAGKAGMRVGGRIAEAAVRKCLKHEVAETLKRVTKKLGFELSRRTIANSLIPLASIYIGAKWNKKTTKAIGKIAVKHFTERRRLKFALVPSA